MVAAAANEAFARGDRALLELRERTGASAADRERSLNAAFDAWRAALLATATGDAAFVDPAELADAGDDAWPNVDGTERRRAEGVEHAAIRRLASLSNDDRARWRARFDAASQAELASALSTTSAEALAKVERSMPLTRGAARAAIALADLSHEEGRAERARDWLARARAHLELGGDDAELARAIAARQAKLPATPESATPIWSFARALEPAWAIDFGARDLDRRDGFVGWRTGGAMLGDGRMAVHTRTRLWTIDPERRREPSSFEPDAVLEPMSIDVGAWDASSEPPGWSLTPVAVESDVVLIVGRAGHQSHNALARFALPKLDDLEWPVARVRWAIWRGRLYDGQGNAEDLDDRFDANAEWQPGAIAIGSELFALTRSREPFQGTAAMWSEREEPTSLWSIDLATGRPLWRRELGRGLARLRDERRWIDAALNALAPSALTLAGRRLFVGTQTGFGALVDPLDGRIGWTLLNRRRSAERRGWSGERVLWNAESDEILWPPADGDRAYVLRGDPDLDGRGIVRAPPIAASAIFSIAGFDRREVLAVAERNGRASLVAIDRASSRRIRSLELSPDEPWIGSPLVSAQRVVAATPRRVYLFDRERELECISVSARVFASSSGALLSFAGGVALVSDAGVQTFKAR